MGRVCENMASKVKNFDVVKKVKGLYLLLSERKLLLERGHVASLGGKRLILLVILAHQIKYKETVQMSHNIENHIHN